MILKDAKIGSIIICCRAKAKVLSRGALGTRVNVLEIPEDSGFTLGTQIWSSGAIVKRSKR